MQQLRTARLMMDMRQKNPAQPAESWLMCLDHAFVYELQTVGGLDLDDLADLNKPVTDKDGNAVMVQDLDEKGLPLFETDEKGNVLSFEVIDGETGQTVYRPRPVMVPRMKFDMAMAYRMLFHLSATWRRRNGIKMTIEEFFDELPDDLGAPIQVISSLFSQAFGSGETAKANVAKAQAAGATGNESAQEPELVAP